MRTRLRVDPSSFAWDVAAFDMAMANPDVDVEGDDAAAARVDELIGRLPEPLAEVAMLVFVSGVSYRQAAQLLGVARSTLYDRAQAAACALRMMVLSGGTEVGEPWVRAGRVRLARALLVVSFAGWGGLSRWGRLPLDVQVSGGQVRVVKADG